MRGDKICWRLNSLLGIQVEELMLIGKVIGGFVAVVLIMSAPWMLIDLYATRKAKRVILAFCSENNLGGIRRIKAIYYPLCQLSF